MSNSYQFDESLDQISDEIKPILIGPCGEDRVPLAIEFVYTLVRIVTVMAVVAVIILSILAHVQWTVLLFRILVTILAVGLAGYITSWMVGKYYIQAAVAELKEIERSKTVSPEL